MSASHANPAPPRHAGAEAPGHGTLKSYLAGFLLSAVLTAVPFWLVMSGALSNLEATVAAIFLMAAAQMVVHIVCFLHVTRTAEGGWTLVALVFTAVLLLILIIGSLWIMYHLNTNMMSMAPGGNGGVP